jgi:rhamnogalacturonyl hydrolase YesR
MSGTVPATGTGCVEVPELGGWMAGKGPAEIGKAAGISFLPHTKDDYGGAGYALVFTWFGALDLAKTISDTATYDQLIKDFEPYASGSKAAPAEADPCVDTRAFGQLPLGVYLQNQDERSKKLGLSRADNQWAKNTNGITNDIRWWADDMFMITGLQVRAYRATKDMKYLERSAKAMTETFKRLQQSNGLFWHTENSHIHWGRANGWVASGMTELLLDLPTGETRDAVMKGYKAMMDGLVAAQIKDGADAGLWRQIVDLDKAPGETSCTAMFTFALVSGVRNGWLSDAKYVAAAKAGWTALGAKVDAKGQLDKVCEGTGQPSVGASDVKGQQDFYLGRKIGPNDNHGQCALLWAANALARPDCPGRR